MPLVRKEKVTTIRITVIHAVGGRSALELGGDFEMCSGRLDGFLTGGVTQCEL